MYQTIQDIKAANKAAGFYFFTNEAMAFFRSRYHHEVLHGRYFFTLETSPSMETKYTVREALADGSIRTVGQFHAHETLRAAKRFLRDYLANADAGA